MVIAQKDGSLAAVLLPDPPRINGLTTAATIPLRACSAMRQVKKSWGVQREVQMAVERIDYQAGSVTGKGALVWNEKISIKRPLLLVMPNWLGVTEHAIKRICLHGYRPERSG
jgi:hypothetical protein